MTVSLAVFHFEGVDNVIEDAMLHHEPRRTSKALRTFVKRCRELRVKLDKAKTPEEIKAIEAELDACKREFVDSCFETADRECR